MSLLRRRREEKLFRAIESDDDTTARELLNHGGLDWKNPEWHYSTPLHMCARSNAWKCVKALLVQKVDVDAHDADGKTVGHLSVVGAVQGFACWPGARGVERRQLVTLRVCA
jgi:ankyrin repeat protein